MSASDDVISLSHLTALRSLRWTSFRGPSLSELTLPQQPVKLVSYGKLQLVGPFNLPEVEHRTSCQEEYSCQLLLQLASSPHLRSLEVSIEDAEALSQPELREFGAVIGTITTLTALCFSAVGHASHLQHIGLLQQLRKLPSLVELNLDLNSPRVGDGDPFVQDYSMLQLSELTGLTQLTVEDSGLDDIVAAAVALSLTRLEELTLGSSSMVTWAALPVIAGLTGLRSLAFAADGVVTLSSHLRPAVLQQLSSLTLLTQLTLPVHHLSGADRQQFLASMPSLRA